MRKLPQESHVRGGLASGYPIDGLRADLAMMPDGLLETVLRRSSDCIKLLGLNGRVEFISQSGVVALEIEDVGSVIGRQWQTLWPEQSTGAIREAVRRAASGGVGSFQGQCPTQKGSPRWWDVRVSPIQDGCGKPERLLAISRDITEQHRAKEELEGSEERYRALVAASTAIVWRSDPVGRVIEGLGWREFAGEFRDEHKGFGWFNAIHPDDRALVLARWHAAVANRSPITVDYRARLRTGEYRWARARAVPFKAPDGTVREWVGTLADIHQQHEAEAAVRDSEERLRLAVEATGIGIWDHDRATGVHRWSPQLRRMLGVPENEPAGRQRFLDLVHPADRGRVETQLGDILDRRAGQLLEAEFRIRRASDGAERWVCVSGRAIVDSGGRVTRSVGTAADITARKEAEGALRDSEERFRKMAATSPDGFISISSSGEVTFWNKAAEEMFGYLACEVVGHSVEIIVPERLRRAHDVGLRRALRSSATFEGGTTQLQVLHRSGREFPVEISMSVWTHAGQPTCGVTVRDISERRAQEERLHRLAHYDALTGLPNRALLMRRMSDALQTPASTGVFILDLDGFKVVNDTLGHAAGDELLKELGRRLEAMAPERATVSRLGGDEFVVFLPGLRDAETALDLSGDIRSRLEEPFVVQGQTAYVDASIGIALSPTHGTSPEELILNSDLALYAAKAEGGGVPRLFTPGLRSSAQARLSLTVEFRRALEQNEFELHYQPQVRLSDRTVVGAEALLRWRHPERGLLSPASFLSELKRSPLAARVGDWTIRQAAAQAARLRAGGRPIRVAVNLFSAQFRKGNLLAVVTEALAERSLDPALIELEITENIALKNDPNLESTLRDLRDLGVSIAFDDYGTGYASLSMLNRFPLTTLKIDRSFVERMGADGGDRAIVGAILQLGKKFGLTVIAEGIETRAQERLLRSLDCDQGQGFLYGRPCPASALEVLLESGPRSPAKTDAIGRN